MQLSHSILSIVLEPLSQNYKKKKNCFLTPLAVSNQHSPLVIFRLMETMQRNNSQQSQTNHASPNNSERRRQNLHTSYREHARTHARTRILALGINIKMDKLVKSAAIEKLSTPLPAFTSSHGMR